MTTPTVSVDTADIRKAAARVREAADELTKRLNEVSAALSPAGKEPDGWATVAAMGRCAGAATGQLHGLVDGLGANADELRDAAARYDATDRQSAHRYRYE
jgi:hypothetical protein